MIERNQERIVILMHTKHPYQTNDSHLFDVEKIRSHIIRIRMPGNVFTYYIKGDNSGVLIDTGLGYGSLRSFLEDPASDLAFGQTYSVLLTHGHLDHAGGIGEFEEVYLHPADYDLALRHQDKDMRISYLRENGVTQSAEHIGQRLISADASTTLRSCEDLKTLDLGGICLTLIPLPGHTCGSLCILIKEPSVPDGILLTGDALNSWTLLFSAPDSPPMQVYHDALVHLKERYGGQFRQVLYSHPHNIGGPEILDQMIELTDEILSGRNSDASAILFMGKPALVAKPVDTETLLRRDGKLANVTYDPGNLTEENDLKREQK